MISVFVGENSFEVHEAMARLMADFKGTPERYEGESLDRAQLADLFGGNLLFATERLIIIRDLSKNTLIWPVLPDWIEAIADTTHVVLIEEKIDKRTATYKTFKSADIIHEFALWSDRDMAAAQAWVSQRASKQGVMLSPALARLIVERAGLDQWRLASAIDKLSLLDEVTKEAIVEQIDTTPRENVFQLFELALQGQRARLREALRTIQLSEDPYMVFALLSSQAAQLGVVVTAKDEPVAKDFGIHPFVASKLASAAAKRGVTEVRRIVGLFAKADVQMKTTSVDPWRVIEVTLVSI
jgi:DNA polymerase III subunit delta